jgi:hypothetical protein
MPAGTVRVKGLREFQRAVAKADQETKGVVREKLREAGDVVRVEATRRFDPVSAKSAAGYRTRVRIRGVAVEQSLRRTTGKRADWGRIQMVRALEPALDAKSRDVEAKLEDGIDELADIVEGRFA